MVGAFCLYVQKNVHACMALLYGNFEELKTLLEEMWNGKVVYICLAAGAL